MKQESVSSFLTRTSLVHLRPEMTLPTLTYQVSYKNLPEGYDGDAEIRVDGREERTAPAPLEYATIGSNGRDTVTGQVHFLGIDIDASNHAAGHADEKVNGWVERLRPIPWLHIIRSRSGRGIHLYVFLGREIFAQNASEVYELGRALKQRIAEEAGFDFLEVVDCAGSMMFYYSPNPGENGYQVVKAATELFTEALEPGCRTSDPHYRVDDLDALESEHHGIVDWFLANAKKDFVQADPTLFKAHTTDIQAAHEALNLKGSFETVATGSGDSKPNCWLAAIPGGRFLVGQWGSDNEKSWLKDSNGNRFCILNQPPDIDAFAEKRLIARNGRNRSYGFTKDEATEFCRDHGTELPDIDTDYFAVSQSNGVLMFEVCVSKKDALPEHWRRKSPQRAYFSIPLKRVRPKPDNFVRVAYAEGGKGFGYYRSVHNNYWHESNVKDASSKLETLGYGDGAIKSILGTDTPYRIVNEPFAGEFPRKYEWNRGATQLAFPIADTHGNYTHWQMILDHCGEAFNEAVSNDSWCREFGVHTGADYLKLWIARLLRSPKERLPGIALYSELQNTGKSTFAASHGRLMTGNGYVNSARGLTTDFNKQLFGCVLWDFDDVNLAGRSGELYGKIKPLMTNDRIGMCGKGETEIQVDNTLHFVHSGNAIEYFAVQSGDTRWILGEVRPLEQEIPEAILTRRLLKEAPYYLRALFDLPMPEPAGRLFLPVLDTPLKNRLLSERSRNGMTPDQRQLLSRLHNAAANGKLSDWVTFDQLKRLTQTSLTAQEFKGVWPRYAADLERAGFKTAHRSNLNGRTPAAWVVHPLTPEHEECFTHSPK